MTVPTSLPDPRTHAYDPEEGWAEERLRGLLPEGDWTWVTARPARAGNARLSLRARPDALAPQVTEAWPGEALELLWEAGAWVRVRTVADGYLGWARREGVLLGELPAGAARLTVGALRAQLAELERQLGLEPFDPARLRQVLLNHVIQGRVTATALASSPNLTNLGNAQLPLTRQGNVTRLGNAAIQGEGIATSNGTVYIIDTVLVPAGQ